MTVDVHLGDEQGLDRSRRYLRPVARLQLADEPNLVHLAVYEWLPQFEAWATGPGICGRSTRQGPLPEGTPITCDACEARRPEYENHFAALVPRQPDATPAAYDAATLAVLQAMEEAAEKHLDAIRPHNTKRGYANDWALWEEFHDWLGERTGHRIASTNVTKGTLVGFVVWLDTIKLAAPNSIDRRITGVTVTARNEHGVEVPKAATVAARQALKPLKNDPERMARGRGKAAAVTPEQLRQMNAAVADGLTGLRDRALWLMAFSIAGRSAEVAALRADTIAHVSQGLEVHVPAVKGRPPRDVVVHYGKIPDTCPVRAWLTWRAAAGITTGPAFLPITVHGRLGNRALSPEAVREIIARNAERAGLSVRLTGHSMRAGFITTSRRAGKREEKIREQSGHAENSPAFWGYIREADKWTDAASEDIGL